MDNLLDVFISFSLSQLLLCTILLIRNGRRSLSETIFICLLLADATYLISPWVNGHWMQFITGPTQASIPALFWLFSYSLFDDHFRLKRWQLIPFIITVGFPIINTQLPVYPPDWQYFLFRTTPQWSELILLVWALAIIIHHWRGDLLEHRRTLRLWFSGFIGFYIFTLIVARELVFPGEQWLQIWQYLPAGLMLLVCNCVLLDFKTDAFSEAPPREGKDLLETTNNTDDSNTAPVETVISEEVPDKILKEIEQLMVVQHSYQEMGLTIGQLAKTMGIQEYRLRRIINAGLGYRNFNDFLNTYRIAEACRRLSSEEDSSTAILNIALDAGFRSLSSFNKAFKDSQGLTPTAFRNVAKEKTAKEKEIKETKVK